MRVNILPESSARLDFFRILCTLFVVGIHTNTALRAGKSVAFPLSLAMDIVYRTAVPGFFLLAGFLLIDKADYTTKFFKNRMQRIMPGWMFWSVIYLVYRVVGQENRISLVSGVRCIWVGDTYYHLWFMYSLFGLYLCLPILRFFCNASGVRKSLIAASLYYFLDVVLVDLGDWAKITGFSFVPAVTFGAMSQAMFLALLGWSLTKWTPQLPQLRAALFGFLFLFLLVFSVAMYTSESGETFVVDSHRATFLLPMSILFFVLVLHSPFRPCRNAIVKLLSDASFGIYLAHPLVYETCIAPWSRHSLADIPGAETVLTFALTMALIVILRKVPLVGQCC
jgi:surface polysaccharide O-acyltransferase-like enzyme